MPDFIYPTNAQLIVIDREKAPRLTADRPIFDILPIEESDQPILIWEQEDSFAGLQHARGLNGAPARVKKIGWKRFMSEPGYYGEFETLDEQELTMRRAMGSWDRPVNVTDMITAAQDKLTQRRIDRIEFILWQLLINGRFLVSRDGVIMHQGSFDVTQYTAIVPWATSATATPLSDFRVTSLLSRGRGASFGSGATAYMNATTFTNLVQNTNLNDMGGRQGKVLETGYSANNANTIMSGQGLPRIVVYDDGYNDESGAYNLWIPNNKVLLVGARPAGQRIGSYRMTLNVNANDGRGGRGVYQRVIDRGVDQIPRTIEIHDGHNGGPVLLYPGSFVVMNV